VSPLDYIWGKYISLLFYLLTFTLIPAIILLLIKIGFSGFDGVSIKLVIGILFYPLLVGSVMSLLTLWISSLSSNSRWVKALFFIFLFGLPAIGSILTGISGGDHRFMLIDLTTNIVQTGHFFFAVKSEIKTAPWISAIILLFMSMILFYLINRKIKRVEV
jgi:hypothetical protein